MLYVLPHVAGRTWKTTHELVNVARRHVPKWLGVVLAVILAVPLGFDDLIALAIVVAFLIVKPQMRREMLTTIRQW